MVEIKIFENYNDLCLAIGKKEKIDQVTLPIDTKDINTIDDLLMLISYIKEKNYTDTHIKFQRLVACYEILLEINQLIGLKKEKSNIVTHVMSMCSILDETHKPNANIVIYGSPGCGKTTLARLLGKLYYATGYCSKSVFITGSKEAMCDNHIGGTAIKTKALLESALDGVFFLDEAYQLGHAVDGNRDEFAYEAINTMVQFITDHPGQIVIILAGYEADIKANLFAQNDGLDRRFPYRYLLEPYTSQDLYDIFIYQMRQNGFSCTDVSYHHDNHKLIKDIKKLTYLLNKYQIDLNIDQDTKISSLTVGSYQTLTDKYPSTINMFAYPYISKVLNQPAITVELFKKYQDPYFLNNGGDTENFFNCCRKVHDKRMFGQFQTDKILTADDIEKGLKIFISHRKLSQPATMSLSEAAVNMYQ